MKKISIVFICLMFGLVSFAQFSRGKVMESLTLDSEILGKKAKYTIYLPFDYETSNRYYPVLYLLHGYGDNDMGWVQFGEAHMLADELIAMREIPPMIIVMPDGGTSFYINNIDQSVRYEDFFVQEFMPYIENNYRIRTEKRYRAITGLSMGGYGTLNYSLKYPEKFSAAVALSPAVISKEYITTMTSEKYNRVYAPVFGAEKQFGKHYQRNNPVDVSLSKGAAAYRGLRLMIDCGDDDFLSKDNCMLHMHLIDMGVVHEFRMRDGAHTWSYWRNSLPDALKFVGESFHQL